MKSAKPCPRCGGFIPSNARPGEYLGALSRVDNATEVCSDCGTEEALVALFPIEKWPVFQWESDTTDAAHDRWMQALDMIAHGDCVRSE
jgi:hypothetical protein